MSLPQPRRIIATHTPDGSPQIIDTALPLYPLPNGLSANAGFVQKSFVAKPHEAAGGAEAKPEGGMFQPGGVTLSWIDVPAGKGTGMHFTNTIDYIVLAHGELVFKTHDGESRVVRSGDVVVQVANAHEWLNGTDQAARMVAVTLPSEPTTVGGKGLDESLGVYKLG